MKKYILSLTILAFFTQCQGNASEIAATENISQNAQDQTFEDFFKEFQTALRADNRQEEVLKLCDFSQISKEKFIENFEYYFDEGGVNCLLNADPKTATYYDFEFETPIVSDYKQIAYTQSGEDVEGNFVEYSRVYIFGKINGNYRLISFVMPG